MSDNVKVDALRTFLENNKIFFEIISIIIFGAASLFLAYASNVVANTQTRLAEIHLEPFLYINEKYILNEETSIAENTILEVHNSGAEIISPKISERTFYRVKIDRKEIYVPVNGFYFIQRSTNQPKGRLSTYEAKNNNNNYARVYMGFLNDHFKDNYGYVELTRKTLVMVEYETLSGKNRKQMFLGDKRVSADSYLPLFEAHHKYPNMPAVESVSAEEIYQHALKIKSEERHLTFGSNDI